MGRRVGGHVRFRSGVCALTGALALSLLLGARAGGQLPDEGEAPEPPQPAMEYGWQPEASYDNEWNRPIRREPAPIPDARPLPFYPPAPPAVAPPETAVSAPPDFLGSAAGYLEIPVGQTATLLTPDAFEAAPREPRVARVVAKQPDRVLVRGLFPGDTLLDVWQEGSKKTYLVRVR